MYASGFSTRLGGYVGRIGLTGRLLVRTAAGIGQFRADPTVRAGVEIRPYDSRRLCATEGRLRHVVAGCRL